MANFDHVVLKFDEFGKGSVSVNGHELKSTSSVSFEAHSGEPTTVVIRMFASIEADVMVADTHRRQSMIVIHQPLGDKREGE